MSEAKKEYMLVTPSFNLKWEPTTNLKHLLYMIEPSQRIVDCETGEEIFTYWDSRESILQHLAGEEINRLAKDVYKINLVTCGNCGCINSHTLDAENVKCVKCGYEDEPSSFPDLFY